MSRKTTKEDYGVSLNIQWEPTPCFKEYQRGVGILEEEITSITGKLDSVKRVTRQGQRGEFEMFYFNFVNGDDKFGFSVSSSMMRTIVNTLLSADLDKEIKIAPYTKTWESNGKEGMNKLFYITQEGEMVRWSMDREEQQSMIKMATKADGSQERDFSLLNKHFSDLFNQLEEELEARKDVQMEKETDDANFGEEATLDDILGDL